MSKNKYILPMKGIWYIEYGGVTKKNSHSWDIIAQRYAYDFEIRKNDLPYHDDETKCENYYSYQEEVVAPLDGWVVDICNQYENTKILSGRPAICDCDDPKGNYILIKHKYNEYSLIAHLQKNTFKVKVGDMVKQGQTLAKVGNSGNTEGPHIHFQVQDKQDFKTAIGKKISFQNTYYIKVEKEKKRKYLTKGNYVFSKKV